MGSESSYLYDIDSSMSAAVAILGSESSDLYDIDNSMPATKAIFGQESSCFYIHGFKPDIVYVEWAKKWSCVNFVTIFGDLYNIKLWGIWNNFNQFAHMSSASGPSNDVIKMAAITQL